MSGACRYWIGLCFQLQTRRTKPARAVAISSSGVVVHTAQSRHAVELRDRNARSFARARAAIFLRPQWTDAGRRLRTNTERHSTITAVHAIDDCLAKAAADSRRYVSVVARNWRSAWAEPAILPEFNKVE